MWVRHSAPHSPRGEHRTRADLSPSPSLEGKGCLELDRHGEALATKVATTMRRGDLGSLIGGVGHPRRARTGSRCGLQGVPVRAKTELQVGD